MNIGLQQSLNVSQQLQLVMTPQLQQAIKLLQLSRMELSEMIQQEMEMNPALEEASHEDDNTSEAEQGEEAPVETDIREVTIEDRLPSDMDWENYINEYNSTGRVHTEFEHVEAPNYEAFTTEKTSLKSHLEWQLMMQGFSREQDEIGRIIIGNLNRFDPPGVCARDLKETLLIQLDQLGITDQNIIQIVSHHLKDIENKNSKKIARALKISPPLKSSRGWNPSRADNFPRKSRFISHRIFLCTDMKTDSKLS